MCVYDSLPSENLSSDIQIQIAKIYGGTDKESDEIVIKRAPVQKQIGICDCGVFALAFAYHAARGDKVEELTFDQASMRKHLVKCFEDEKFTPFPQTSDPVFKSASSTVHLSLYCCRMPECYDSMVCCDICNLWYHFKCAGIICTCKPTVSCECASSRWICSNC